MAYCQRCGEYCQDHYTYCKRCYFELGATIWESNRKTSQM